MTLATLRRPEGCALGGGSGSDVRGDSDKGILSSMGRLLMVARAAATLALIGVFLTWTRADGITLDGTQGPNNGWLVVIVAAFAFGWAGSLARGSRVGVVGVLGAGLVIVWTALESWGSNRAALQGAAGIGTVLVVAAGLVLVGVAVARVITARRQGFGSTAR